MGFPDILGVIEFVGELEVGVSECGRAGSDAVTTQLLATHEISFPKVKNSRRCVQHRLSPRFDNRYLNAYDR